MIFSLSVLFWLFEIPRIDFTVTVPLCFSSSSSLGPTSSPPRDRTLSLSSSPCCTTSALTPSSTWSRSGVSHRPLPTWPSHSCSKTSTTPRAPSASCSRPSNTSWPISTCNFVNSLNIETISNCNSINSRGLKQSQPVTLKTHKRLEQSQPVAGLNYRGLKQPQFKS